MRLNARGEGAAAGGARGVGATSEGIGRRRRARERDTDTRVNITSRRGRRRRRPRVGAILAFCDKIKSIEILFHSITPRAAPPRPSGPRTARCSGYTPASGLRCSRPPCSSPWRPSR
eukprot:4411-Pelagococcus_subviridis.AAC.2